MARAVADDTLRCWVMSAYISILLLALIFACSVISASYSLWFILAIQYVFVCTETAFSLTGLWLDTWLLGNHRFYTSKSVYRSRGVALHI